MDVVKDAPSNPSPSRYVLVCSLHNVRKKSWETSSVTRQYAKLQGKAHGNSTRRSGQYPMPGDPIERGIRRGHATRSRLAHLQVTILLRCPQTAWLVCPFLREQRSHITNESHEMIL